MIAHAHAGAAGHGRHVHSAHIHFDGGYRDHELKKTEGCKKQTIEDRESHGCTKHLGRAHVGQDEQIRAEVS